MNNNLEELLDLENRILEERKKLLNISRDMDNSNLELYKNKISMLEHEIDYMSSQIRYMKAKMARPEDIRQKETQVQDLKLSSVSGSVFRDEENAPQWQTLMPKNQTPVSGATNANKDLEKAFGKSFMGIAASVLIFISLILFATYVMPMLGEFAKMAIMYVISFAFLFAGVYRMSKDKDNRFNIALTGCGLGALYISLLLTNIYFRAIGDIALYVLIAFWGGLVCFFARNKNYIFQIIGEIGILIATIFGAGLCIDYKDTTRFIALLIFYLLTSAIFYFVNYEKDFEKNLCYHVFAAIGGLVLTIACGSFEGTNDIICFIIVAAIMALNIVGILTHRLDKQQEFFGIIGSTYLIYLTVILAIIIPKDEIWGIVAYALGMVMVVVTSSFKQYKDNVGLYIIALTSIIIAFTGLCVNGPAYNYGVVWLMIIPLLVYGYIKNNDFYKVSALVIMFIYLFVYDDISIVLHFVFVIAEFAVAYICLFCYKKQYNFYYKMVLHIGTLLVVGTQMVGTFVEIFGDRGTTVEIIWTVVHMCFFALNTICYKSKFASNFATGEKENDDIVYIIANAIAMAFGLILIGNAEIVVCHLVSILVTFAAFMLKSKSILDKDDASVGLNVYVGGKFTVFLIVVLMSLKAVNYVISIACLLLAILFILIGFMGGYKYLRIYGLGLTMISIFKLLMIDVKYENTLGYAVSFFVSGLLCFVISMIYNYLDKKISE